MSKLSKINICKIQYKDKETIIDEIIKYYSNLVYPFKVIDIQSHIQKVFGVNWSYQKIKDIMKIDLRLSYKRCLSRQKIVDYNKIKLWRKLFSLKFLTEINPESLVAGWDEYSINRNTKLNYSWSVIGINKEIKNASLTRSIFIIMSIFLNEC